MMNNNYREDQWLQHYEEQHQIQEIPPCLNAINMATSSVQESSGRRSRAPRRAVPTTLLNANPSNFRALVQKFTGRSSGSESNRRKGPVTLDFASPTTVSKEAIFPVSSDRSSYDHDLVLNHQHVSNEQPHVTWSGTESTMSYQLGEESNSGVHGSMYDDQDLMREYSGNSSFDETMDQMDYYHDFHLETATLEEFMMSDLDL